MSRDYCDYIIDMLRDWHPVTTKRMFGGFALYKQGQVFALILNDTLYFKVDDSNRADYEMAGSEPFIYEAKGKPITISYWQVPAELFDDVETLAQWAERSYQVGLLERNK